MNYETTQGFCIRVAMVILCLPNVHQFFYTHDCDKYAESHTHSHLIFSSLNCSMELLLTLLQKSLY